jgi:hypothetical protein
MFGKSAAVNQSGATENIKKAKKWPKMAENGGFLIVGDLRILRGKRGDMQRNENFEGGLRAVCMGAAGEMQGG